MRKKYKVRWWLGETETKYSRYREESRDAHWSRVYPMLTADGVYDGVEPLSEEVAAIVYGYTLVSVIKSAVCQFLVIGGLVFGTIIFFAVWG